MLKKVKNNMLDILIVILSLLLAVMITSMAVTYFANGRDPARMNVLGYKVGRVLSGSMEPTYYKNTLVLFHVGETDVQPGDVVVYENYNECPDPIIHRVKIVYSSGNIETKGDNNKRPDPWITDPDHIVGKVVWYTNLFTGKQAKE